MDAADRTVLAEAVGSAIAAGAGGDTGVLDRVLTDLGWLDMLDSETDAAVGIVFHALGSTNGHATALDDVVAHALGFAPRRSSRCCCRRSAHGHRRDGSTVSTRARSGWRPRARPRPTPCSWCARVERLRVW